MILNAILRPEPPPPPRQQQPLTTQWPANDHPSWATSTRGAGPLWAPVQSDPLVSCPALHCPLVATTDITAGPQPYRITAPTVGELLLIFSLLPLTESGGGGATSAPPPPHSHPPPRFPSGCSRSILTQA